MAKNCAHCPAAAKCAAAEAFLASQMNVAEDLARREPEMTKWRSQVVDGFEGLNGLALPDHDDFDDFLSAEAALRARRQELVLGHEALERAPATLAQVRTNKTMVAAMCAQRACLARSCMAEPLGDHSISIAMAGQREVADERTFYVPQVEIGE